MAKSNDHDIVLGVGVGVKSIDAVLVKRDGLRYQILGQYSKARNDGPSGGAQEITSLIPGLQSNEDTDYTLEIGGASVGGGSSDLFVGGGVSNEGARDSELAHESVTSKPRPSNIPHFESEFRQILAEARIEAGATPQLAFCVSDPDVVYGIVSVSDEEEDGKRFRSASTDKELIKRLVEKGGSEIERDRVGFLEMTPSEKGRRFLSMVRDENDAVVQTIRIVAAIEREKLPQMSALDTELSLITMMLGRSAISEGDLSTAVVRVGSQDTLIAFYEGEKLRHYDWLRSVNIFDAPETICSRVLLQQDEKKIGEIDHVLVLANSRTDALHNTFSRYYPNATVLHFDRLLADCGLELGDENDPLRTGMALAAAVAVSVDERESGERSYINLAPSKLAVQRKRKLELGWHTVAMMPILFLVTFFFVFRYLQNENEIGSRERELMMNPLAPPVTNSAVLETRVDSLEQAYVRFTRGLKVLDSLLVGSDKWSRFLETVTRATRDLDGVWLIN